MNFQQKLLGFNNSTIVLIQLICTIFWFLPFVLNKEPQTSFSISFLGNTIFQYSPLTAAFIQYFFISIIGFVINNILKTLQIIPLNNLFFYCCFIFIFSITPQAQYFNTTSFSFFILLLALYYLLTMFQSEAVFKAFNCMFFLCIATLFNIEYVWIIPFFWMGFILLKAFTKNTFLASIFGLLTFIIALISIAYLTNNWNIIENYFAIGRKIDFLNFKYFSINYIEFFEYIYFFVFLIFYIIICFINRYEQNNILYIYYSFFIFFTIFLVFIYFINSNFYKEIWMPLLSLIAFFSTFYYNSKQTKFSNILLSIFVLLGICYRLVNLFV